MLQEIINAVLPNGEKGAIQIFDGRITGVGPAEGFKNFLDADGLWVVPGLINMHVHFRTPGEQDKEDWHTGTAAALAGGCTTVGDMPNNSPRPCTSFHVLRDKMKYVGVQPVDARFWLGAQPGSLWRGELSEARILQPLIVGVKTYFDISTGELIVREQKDRIAIAQAAAEYDMVNAVHAESETVRLRNISRLEGPLRLEDHCVIRSAESEIEAVKEAIEVQRCSGVKMLVCHVSHPTSIELILRAQDRGQNIHIEVCPHHLFLTSGLLGRMDGAFFQMNPPLRSPEEAERLLDYVCKGYIQTIASDHAPHEVAEKVMKRYPNTPSGVPGVQDLFSLMFSLVSAGRITIQRFIELTSTNAANLFGLKKGRIESGYEADLVLFDPVQDVVFKNEDQLTKCGWSPFALAGLWGMGVPQIVIQKGIVRYTKPRNV